MFKCFFLNRQWFWWSIVGTIAMIAVTWGLVQIDVKINAWLGQFYNLIQQALTEPGSIELKNYYMTLLDFLWLAGTYVIVAVGLDFFTKHWLWRWRTSLNERYIVHWQNVRTIEGSSQRLQEDVSRLVKIMEGLGSSLLSSIMTLIAFLPVMWALSAHVTSVPIIGEVSQALVYIIILWSVGGTVLLAVVGIKLPGLEYNNQLREAAYRKSAVHFEDEYDEATGPQTFRELFEGVRKNYFKLFWHYAYFNIIRISYLQVGTLVPYFALGPTVIAGVITLGILQQIIQAFNRLENSTQYLVNSWPTIIDLISIWKRLYHFEQAIKISEKQSSP